WNGDVAAQIASFLMARVQSGERYRLYLDAHGAIAFDAGWLLHRADVTPMQTTDGRMAAWPASGVPPDGPLWHTRDQAIGSSGGPNGFMFQLGRNRRPMGQTTIYEFDFDNPQRGYAPAISIPTPKEAP